MRLKILLILGILSGCGPKAPKLNFCSLDATSFLGTIEKHVQEGMSRENIIKEMEEFRPVYCDGISGAQELTLRQAHKYIMQPLADAQKLREYVLGLEEKLAHCH